MSSADTNTAVVLLDLAAMITAGSILGALAARWRQPAVIGEIVAGIILGPSLLGLFPGHLTERLFPPDGRPFLSVIANVGLVLFMFGIGFEVDFPQLRRTGAAAAVVSSSSMIVPFLLGGALALLLHPWHRGTPQHPVGLVPFALFLGVATSITAFPVLARILAGLGLHRAPLGSFVMTCAAVADVAAWALLAVVVALVAGGGFAHTAWELGGMVLFIVTIAVVGRPLLRAILLADLTRRHSEAPVAILVIGLLVCAWVTTRLGFHPIFGAFAFGAIVPRAAVRQVAPEAPLLIERASQFLVPVFFITTGLNVDISGLGARGGLELSLVLLVACIGKFVGATGAARLCRMDRRRAAAVGVLMNSRGLTELVVIQVGLSLGVLDVRLASAMIAMALITTIAATPLFRLLYDRRLQQEDDGLALAAQPVPVLDSAGRHTRAREDL